MPLFSSWQQTNVHTYIFHTTFSYYFANFIIYTFDGELFNIYLADIGLVFAIEKLKIEYAYHILFIQAKTECSAELKLTKNK